MSGTRYYVIGDSIQVMNKNWLSPFPKDRKEVKDSDIFNSLTPGKDEKSFMIFTNLETAKQCAAIETSNDNMTVSAVSTNYRPVIEVSLSSQDAEHLKPAHLDIIDGCGSHLKTDAFQTSSDNIEYVHSYYYRAGSQNVTVQLSESVDLQKTFRNDSSSGCSIQ